MGKSLNANILLSLLAVGYALAHWGSLVLPASVMAWFGWINADFCAGWLVGLTVYFNVLQDGLGTALVAGKGMFSLGAKGALDVAQGVVNKVDVP